MEVTRGNFKESLPLVEKSIKAADFLAIDAEFTGLNSGRDVSMFDSPQDYYRTLLNGSSNFLLIQFGLCAFHWDKKANCYRNDTYNFYVFPRVRPGPERMFLCQSSSLEFLISQGFDFNKLIKDGIPYMTEPVETRLRDLLTERQKLYGTERDIIPIPEEHKEKMEEICKKVQEFLDEKKSDDMEIDRCNAFVRRLVFQELQIKFKNEVVVESKLLDNGNRVIKVTRVKSDSEFKDLESQKKEKEWEDFENAVGFSKVAQMISQSGKLVVGHNMLLDVLHTLNHFFAPIPADYASFKEFAHCMFPWILDTKYMSSLPPFKDKVSSSVLPHLLATLSEPPFKMPEVDSETSRGYTNADEKHHEAGYDAYITGLCFLAMHDHLSRMRGETPPRVSVDAAQLRPFQNKLYLAKTAHQDSSYMNLVGKDPSPSRDHVFHLTYPKQWQRNDINQLFSPYGEITVQFLDDTSALVALSRREQARDVLRALGRAGKGQLITYAEYQRLQSHNDKQWRKPEESVCKTTPPSPVWTSRARKNSSSLSNATYIPEKVERTALPEKVDRRLPEKVDRTLPEKVDRTLPEKVDRTLPEKVHTVSENVERTESVFHASLDEKVDPSPAKVGRTRSSSQSCVSPSPGRGGRKRTSSGMFQVEDEEPPPKKPEVARTSADDARSKPEATNGRRKATKTPEASAEETEVVILKKKKIERFDRTGDVTKVVSVFKESDSWD